MLALSLLSDLLSDHTPNIILMKKIAPAASGKALGLSKQLFLSGVGNSSGYSDNYEPICYRRVSGSLRRLFYHASANVIEMDKPPHLTHYKRLTAPTGLAVKHQPGNDRFVTVAPHPRISNNNLVDRSMSLHYFFNTSSYRKI
jgi:hypothetical protein